MPRKLFVHPVITGAIATYVKASPINTQGQRREGLRENIVETKKFVAKDGRGLSFYVSGPCIRRMLRETLYEYYGWERSPITVVAKGGQKQIAPEDAEFPVEDEDEETKVMAAITAHTEGNPFIYEDDDAFGFFIPLKKEGARFREAPFQLNSAESLPQAGIVFREQRTMSGHLRGDGRGEGKSGEIFHPILYEVEVPTGPVSFTFSLSLKKIGVFTCGKRGEVTEEMYKAAKAAGLIEKETTWGRYGKQVWLTKEKRLGRISDILMALKDLNGGANQTRHLNDFRPRAIVAAVIDGGQALLQDSFIPSGNPFKPVNIRLEFLANRLKQYIKPFPFPCMGGAAHQNGVSMAGVFYRHPASGKCLFIADCDFIHNKDEVRKAVESDPILKEVVAFEEDIYEVLLRCYEIAEHLIKQNIPW
jgi:CRISPR-associated protein Cas7/Cst2/DevR subtype I-B